MKVVKFTPLRYLCTISINKFYIMNKLLTAVLLSSVITLSVQAQKAEEYYVKHVEFPPNATLEQKVDMARA